MLSTRTGELPDFLLIGAPKAGTTALHAALATASRAVPEPGQGAEVLPVRRLAAAGVPGARRRAQQPGVGLAAAALPRRCSPSAGRRPAGGESTPFYLYHRDARRRIAADLPAGPAGRGAARPGRPRLLELDAPVGRRARAVRRRRRGLRAASRSGSTHGWAPFWHYRAPRACTAGSWPTSIEHFPREQVLLLRYRDLVEEPRQDPRPGVPLPRRRRRTWSRRSRRTTRVRS